MTDDTHTDTRRAWLRAEQGLAPRRIDPPRDVHILHRKRYVNAANTDIRKTFARARKALGAA
jgi:hypothetical protein